MFEGDFPDTCISCGLLGVMDRHVYGMPLKELNASGRANGYISDSQILWCLRRMAYPQREVDGLLDARPVKPMPETAVTRAESVNTVLRKHRGSCVEQGAYSTYVEHFDPAWHFEQQRMMQLEEQRRKWEIEMEKEGRAFEERLDESNKAFLAGLEGQRREWEKESGKWPGRLIWAAIILAVAEVTGTFLTLPAITRWLGLD